MSYCIVCLYTIPMPNFTFVFCLFILSCYVLLYCLSLYGILCLILPFYLEFGPCFAWLDLCCWYCLVMSYCIDCACLRIMVLTTCCPTLYLSFMWKAMIGSCFSNYLQDRFCVCLFAYSGIPHILTVWVAWRVCYAKQEMYNLFENLGSPPFSVFNGSFCSSL